MVIPILSKGNVRLTQSEDEFIEATKNKIKSAYESYNQQISENDLISVSHLLYQKIKTGVVYDQQVENHLLSIQNLIISQYPN